jgi:hypothetical protein
MSEKLFAVYLGGRAPKGNTELHDVVFVTGEKIEDTYEQLMDKWFGTPEGLHIDSWMEVDVIDGYRVTLSKTKPEAGKKLYFVYLGAYRGNEFSEAHAVKLAVTDNAPEAKARAKKELLVGLNIVHTDDLYDVDTCFEVGSVNSFHVVLTYTGEQENLKPTSAYHLVPKPLVEDYMRRHGLAKFARKERFYG